jgi:RNA recognition motif-containing protein
MSPSLEFSIYIGNIPFDHHLFYLSIFYFFPVFTFFFRFDLKDSELTDKFRKYDGFRGIEDFVESSKRTDKKFRFALFDSFHNMHKCLKEPFIELEKGKGQLYLTQGLISTDMQLYFQSREKKFRSPLFACG